MLFSSNPKWCRIFYLYFLYWQINSFYLKKYATNFMDNLSFVETLNCILFSLSKRTRKIPLNIITMISLFVGFCLCHTFRKKNDSVWVDIVYALAIVRLMSYKILYWFCILFIFSLIFFYLFHFIRHFAWGA